MDGIRSINNAYKLPSTFLASRPKSIKMHTAQHRGVHHNVYAARESVSVDSRDAGSAKKGEPRDVRSCSSTGAI